MGRGGRETLWLLCVGSVKDWDKWLMESAERDIPSALWGRFKQQLNGYQRKHAKEKCITQSIDSIISFWKGTARVKPVDCHYSTHRLK